ncbi:cation diffusion facilitator family transporter [Phenylobacterium immobile]|uniref:cation diffusion facilitator family transporter n=1 Tax=Phenylobacterium immobile TaxID=21 RepID=UPI000B2D331E|nr:cation diffusion facilitator family transporter [Phenylobacterium immobile]
MAPTHPPHDTPAPGRDTAHDHAHSDDDSHGQDHDHGGHNHSALPDQIGRAFAIGVALNLAFVGAEAGVGVWSGSVALLADAGHNLSDVLSLMLAWGATVLARRAPAGRRTYGLRKATILASLANAVLLMVAVGAIASEAVRRFAEPTAVQTTLVMITAALGVMLNGVTAMLFFKGQHDDLNQKGAFLHMAGDAAVSLAVVAGAGVMALTGWAWIDPTLSLAIAAVIVLSGWSLLRDSTDLALDAAPRGVDVAAVRRYLEGLPGVTGVHDLHIWAMSTTETALTAHVTRPMTDDGDAFLHAVGDALRTRFRIGHTTLQVEAGDSADCRLTPVCAA